MKGEGKDILHRFLTRWRLWAVLEILFYAIGGGLCIYFLTDHLLIAVFVFIGIGGLSSILSKPWRPNLKMTSSYLDTKLDTLEYSTGLFLLQPDRLSSLAKLQQAKIIAPLDNAIKNIRPPVALLKAGIIGGVIIGLGLLGKRLGGVQALQSNQLPAIEEQIIPFHTNDSIDTKSMTPQLIDQKVIIRYPAYTGLATLKTSVMDIKAIEGAEVIWQLQFDQEIKSVIMQSTDNDYPMSLDEEIYSKRIALRNSGFYSFKFEAIDGTVYTSDLYSIEVVKDEEPTIQIKDLEPFSSFEVQDEKRIQWNTNILDDYGITEAHIIATVSKGSGESVKFREEQLAFDTALTKGEKQVSLSKNIDLDLLQLEPGDELYFYIEAIDNKRPKPNVARSDTYFATIKDTASYGFGVEGTLGVDRLADYFRSQRQLIIDTEKLISERKVLAEKEFKFQSNELGFDQKSLRLKYGAFMGEESEEVAVAEPEGDVDHEGDTDHDDEDPLAAYTHDHDGDNEHNLVTDETKKKEESKNPLQEFIHDHGDPESATLFEESLKVKLLKALSEMWDAELYLRLYEPEKSLPYQYKALQYIQEIKNSARIYVHRIGFDPPPIKEDKRLSGKLDEVSGYRKKDSITEEEQVPAIKQAIVRLGLTLEGLSEISETDIPLFEDAGKELSLKAIEYPGKFLHTLQKLRDIIDASDRSIATLTEVRSGLLEAVPKPVINPDKSGAYTDEINQLLLKELEFHD